MNIAGPALLPWMHTRVCLRCGHDGPEMQVDIASAPVACPRCGQDLWARPARSYAEMEGLSATVHPRTPAALAEVNVEEPGLGMRSLLGRLKHSILRLIGRGR